MTKRKHALATSLKFAFRIRQREWAAGTWGSGGMGRETSDSGVFTTRTPSPDPRIDKTLC